MSDVDSEPLVNMVGDGHIETIVAHEVLGRLMIQCARHPGLARVWENLLGFDGMLQIKQAKHNLHVNEN